MDKLRNWCKEKLTKNNMIILALSGLLLMIIALPVHNSEADREKTTQSGLLDKAEDRIEETEEENSREEAMERRLEQFLARMDGVGEVEVMLTFSDSGERVVEKDVPYSQSRTDESDGNGTNRTIASRDQREETVYTEGQIPYVKKTLAPRVQGVTVLAQGGGSAVVRAQITEAVMVLFGLEPHKIKVAKLDGGAERTAATKNP